ncbi:type I restriction/modification system, restriction subunit [Campylobacter blaseri]|uniref:Restriction endonuclease subunit R n=1 Tax=Campylobacter blaseri TaxID=2042961 RepID=A0A2P8QYW7_9BACT|nr:DEAD/DEAH box helicase family protein [Campylobacter blaseri]PSM51441.1 restriction endonuclease subunit R [Campylobacter blaseri]PSM52890.1 restriction endonuclease subunit R [Campylobacter blaseri]QKF86555.1 type I restriction/modification system, restriction subunit [Campylobacter blaseri]
MNPEDVARIDIDKLLISAGFIIQDMVEFNRTASLGIAVREFVMQDGTKADYLIFIDGKACGVIEAKKSGTSLSGVENQSIKYANNLPKNVRCYQNPLPFLYESNSKEIYFTNLKDDNPRSRKIFAFHKPEFLRELLNQQSTLRNKFKNFPTLNRANLRDCQFEAISSVENSLRDLKPRALIQMATGAGKTYTACNFIYRLIKFANAKRVLFLVDRNNLARQTKKEFENFHLSDENRKFSEVYIVQHLSTNAIDKDAKVVITTIQRLYSMLQNESEYDEVNEEISAFETKPVQQKNVVYNPKVPIETFDFIVVDECHRSIYGEWRQVLEYFDAFLIGLTATPSKQTLGYFNKNLVSSYPLERSIVDKINVDCNIFRIKTKISEGGSTIEAGEIPTIDKRTREQRYESLDEDLEYSSKDLDYSVLAPNQIITVLECYKNSIFTQLFPEREPNFVPKTLIFAKDDNHAENITRLAREVFNKGNEFCKKITYNIGNEDPESLIKAFKIDPKFRIAVTVDMIATGTDIKALEVIIFLRDVKSSIYYEQMKGRGVRTINSNDLQSITPNAISKDKFYIIDAVGVTESKKSLSSTLERKKSLSLKKLLENVAKGDISDDTLSTLAGRIVRIEANINNDDKNKIKSLTDGKSLSNITNEILDTLDGDKTISKTQDEIDALKDATVKPFNSPALRTLLVDLSSKSKIYIDLVSTDEVVSADFSKEKAQELIVSFKDFIDKNKDEIEALSIIYNTNYKNKSLTYKLIKELDEKLKTSLLEPEKIWEAYYVIQDNKVRTKKVSIAECLTNLIQLIKFAIGFNDELVEFSSVANSRFELWCGRQINKGISFSDEQMEFLRLIKDYIITNSCLDKNDIQELLGDKGGIFKANKLFSNFDDLLDDLNLAIVA